MTIFSPFLSAFIRLLYLPEMKPITLVVLLFILSACTGHHDAEEFDLIKLKGAAGQLFDAEINGNRIEKQWWPAEIKALNPESVFKGEKGIYIMLDSFFVEESGLFIASPGTMIEPGVHSDPDYVLLGEGIYSYHITG
jgi:hypothetical protein